MVHHVKRAPRHRRRALGAVLWVCVVDSSRLPHLRRRRPEGWGGCGGTLPDHHQHCEVSCTPSCDLGGAPGTCATGIDDVIELDPV
jgi:hypothetical protein